ncbi:hypothetical protein [Paracoccus sp. (in: a-proteobacteria)]|uniref:hypothetical protein n=1 Tax=Paracoccus sp. TaxID=267 RepID=UPI00396C6F52
MKSWNVMMIALAAAGTLLAPAGWAQTAPDQATDGVPGDRLVVPLPDVSTLSEAEAQDLTRELAQMNVITSNCPAYEVSDPEWQLINGTTDALTQRLGIDPVAYDREYFRPAFSLLDDPSNCDRLGPQARELITRLEEMGGSAQAVTPTVAAPAPQAETPGTAPAEDAPAQ